MEQPHTLGEQLECKMEPEIQTIRSLSKHASAAAMTPCSVALLPTSNHLAGFSVKYFPGLLEIDSYTFETSSFTMFIAVDERTLVNMQPLGIQQYFISRWCHQRLEKFQYRHFTNFVYKSRLHN